MTATESRESVMTIADAKALSLQHCKVWVVEEARRIFGESMKRAQAGRLKLEQQKNRIQVRNQDEFAERMTITGGERKLKHGRKAKHNVGEWKTKRQNLNACSRAQAKMGKVLSKKARRKLKQQELESASTESTLASNTTGETLRMFSDVRRGKKFRVPKKKKMKDQQKKQKKEVALITDKDDKACVVLPASDAKALESRAEQIAVKSSLEKSMEKDTNRPDALISKSTSVSASPAAKIPRPRARLPVSRVEGLVSAWVSASSDEAVADTVMRVLARTVATEIHEQVRELLSAAIADEVRRAEEAQAHNLASGIATLRL
jgi:hypothetical protein